MRPSHSAQRVYFTSPFLAGQPTCPPRACTRSRGHDLQPVKRSITVTEPVARCLLIVLPDTLPLGSHQRFHHGSTPLAELHEFERYSLDIQDAWLGKCKYFFHHSLSSCKGRICSHCIRSCRCKCTLFPSSRPARNGEVSCVQGLCNTS